MSASEIVDRSDRPLTITTNVMTPDGMKVVVMWIRPPDTKCMVAGNSLEEALRKFAEFDEDFDKAE